RRQDEARHPGRARPENLGTPPYGRHETQRDRRLYPAPPRPSRPFRHVVHRRRDRPHPHHEPGKPRSVNNLALAALIAACSQSKTIVAEASARPAITETTTDHPTATP